MRSCCETLDDEFTKAGEDYPGGRGDYNDHMRHCVGSCETTKKEGPVCAMGADLREGACEGLPNWLRRLLGRLCSDNDPFDYDSNRYGRMCGSDYRSCDACCDEVWRVERGGD